MAENTSEVPTKPTPAEIARAWGSQGPDARGGGDVGSKDKDIIGNTQEVTDPKQPQPETSTLKDATISDEEKQKTYDKARELGEKANEYFSSDQAKKDIELAKAQEKGKLAVVRTKIKHAVGK